jgi:hypothetical protein
MDVHVPQAITHQLRRRDVDVLTAQEDDAIELEDPDLLRHATALGRVLFTQDIRFRVLAEAWQREKRPFGGLIYAHQRNSMGTLVGDLELIAKATGTEEWRNQVAHLPL